MMVVVRPKALLVFLGQDAASFITVSAFRSFNHDLDTFQHRSIMTIRTGGTKRDVLGARLTYYIGTSQT